MNVHDLSVSLTEALLRSNAITPNGKPGDGKVPPFTVTISREVGALGSTIAALVGERLGWAVYDREILNKVADELGKSVADVRGLDERHVNWLEDCLAGLLSGPRVSPPAYLKTLVGTVRGLGAKGRCAIVGRGANFILSPETTLRVRLVADLKDRIEVIGRRRAISDREAARWIEKVDEDRARFVRDNFSKDPADPHHYDLVLNTSLLNAEECAEIILHALHLREPRSRTGEVAPPVPEAAAVV